MRAVVDHLARPLQVSSPGSTPYQVRKCLEKYAPHTDFSAKVRIWCGNRGLPQMLCKQEVTGEAASAPLPRLLRPIPVGSIGVTSFVTAACLCTWIRQSGACRAGGDNFSPPPFPSQIWITVPWDYIRKVPLAERSRRESR